MAFSSDHAGSGALPTKRLEGLLRKLVVGQGYKEVVCAVATGDRSAQWSGALGETDGAVAPRDAGAPFFIASIDKLFNATLALKLGEEGVLELDAPLATYLPSAVLRGIHCLGGVDYSERITVRHLLAHASGLADWLEDRPAGGVSLVDHVLREGDQEFGLNEILSMLRGALRPHFPPSDLSADRPRVRYSDTNFILLIAVMEAAAGRTLPELWSTHLLQPLGLRHTSFVGRSPSLEPTPAPLDLRWNGTRLALPLLMRSFWGVESTTADLLAFLRALVRGGIFREPGTFGLMQQPWRRFGFPLDRAALRAPGWPIEYGLGIMRFRLPRLFAPWNPVPAVIGHSGSTGCWLFYCPEWDVMLAGSVNEVTAGAVPYRIVPKILAMFRSTRGELA